MTQRYREGDLLVEDVDGLPLYRVRLRAVDWESEATGEDLATALRNLAREVEDT